MADKTLESICKEARLRDGKIVCTRNPQNGRTCDEQAEVIQVSAYNNYKPKTAPMYVCGKVRKMYAQKKNQVKQSPGWDSEITYRTNPYDSDAGWPK